MPPWYYFTNSKTRLDHNNNVGTAFLYGTTKSEECVVRTAKVRRRERSREQETQIDELSPVNLVNIFFVEKRLNLEFNNPIIFIRLFYKLIFVKLL